MVQAALIPAFFLAGGVACLPIAIVIAGSLVIDRMFGDPHSRLHPVALLGTFIGLWGRPHLWKAGYQKIAGVGMGVLTLAIFALPFLLVDLFAPLIAFLILGLFLLKSCFAWRSLEDHVHAVVMAAESDLDTARHEVGAMVSRTTTDLSKDQILSGAYESASENLVDSIVSPLFYCALFGLTGAAIFRGANTLDAMLGYRDERERIGWFSARLDDVLNYLPARLAGVILLLYFACRGRFRPAWEALQRDARKRPGWNGGIPMAIMAGGIGVQFVKPGVYIMGNRERSLDEGGPDIIRAIRYTTIILALLLIGALLLGCIAYG
ncbi:MAG: adenosylcobinamide-phosphate synthase CbiB [Methanomicrobiales archaeon]|nr:adenosylcobinamide-phosphate synthase CbiB [Methanomicrobiales archaeon]